jgi:hypothetical protein
MLSFEKNSLSPDQRTPFDGQGRSSSLANQTMEIKMKTIIAALTLVLLAASPTLAASASAWQLHEGRASAYVPYSGGYSGGTDTSREGLVRSF